MADYHSYNMLDHLEISRCPICAGLPTPLGLSVTYSLTSLGERVSIDYACCPSCGFVFQRNPLTWKSLRAYYQASPRYRDAEVNDVETQLCRTQAGFMESAGPLRERSVLDFGADMGKLLDVLAAEYGCVTSYIEENEEARRYLNNQGRHREVASPLASDCFDWLVFSQVLEHIVNPVEFLATMRRRLVADGRVFVEVPCNSFWDAQEYGFSFEHTNYFSPATLASAFHRAGFTATKLEVCSDARYFAGKARVIRAVAQVAPSSLPEHLVDAVRSHHQGVAERFALLAAAHCRDGHPGLALYGAAELADLLLSNNSLRADEILAVFDTDARKHGTMFHGLQVRPPREIPSVAPAAILILSAAEVAIRETIAATGFGGIVMGWSDLV